MNFTGQLDAIGVPYQRGSKPSEYRICCPYCVGLGETQDERFRLNVNVERDTAFCFNCKYSAKADAQKRVLHDLGMSFVSDVDIEDKPAVPEEPEVDKWPKDQVVDAILPFDKHTREWRGQKYLLKRGISKEDMSRFKIHICLNGRFRERILFPVIRHKVIVGFASRDFGGSATAKYLNSRGPKYLWNFDRRATKFVISEGAIKGIFVHKALADMGRHPKWCSISPLGSSITDSQISQLLEAKVKKVVILPDPDTPGLKGALRIAESLAASDIKVEIVSPTPTLQADEYTTKELISVLSSTTPYNAAYRFMINSGLAFGKASYA
jgi:hypothetical protein